LLNSCTSVIVALTIVLSFSAYDAVADEPKNVGYASLKDAILQGKEPRMLIDFAACQVHGTRLAGPPIKASVKPNQYMIQSDGTIAFATTHFTVRLDGSVREFLSFRVHVDGKIDVHTMILGAVNFEVSKDKSFDCEIGKAATFHW